MSTACASHARRIDCIIECILMLSQFFQYGGQLARRLRGVVCPRNVPGHKFQDRPASPTGSEHKEHAMPAVTKPANQKGDFLVDYEQKVFEDVKALPGEKA